MDRRDEPADVRQDVDPAAQTEVRTEVFAGFVFVNLDPDARPMAEWYPEAERELRAFVPHLERLNPALWIEIPEARNWKVAVENYSECYHCQLNHAGEYSSWFLFPVRLVSGLPRQRAQHLHWRPAAVDRVAVWRGWYTEGGLESDVITKLAQQDRWTTVDEDIRLVESVQRGLGSRGYRPGPLITDRAAGSAPSTR
jgi:phenylpropionate dioxygenase-like ring-hydroxylating dioxygenase large terminal subunit